MARMRNTAGGGWSAFAAWAAGAIGTAGIAVAVALAACEAAWRSTPVRLSQEARERPALAPLAAAEETPARAGSSGGAPPTWEGEPAMRVRILAAASTVRVNGAAGGMGGVVIGQGDPKGSATPAPGTRTEKRSGVSVSLKEGRWVVWEIGAAEGAGGAATTYPAAMPLVLMPPIAGQTLGVNTGVYPGVLRLSARDEGRADTFDVVAFVAMEEYLSGVVAREMLTGWPPAAYQVQAVAARTYALQERQRSMNAGASFDVESSDRDQVYGGATSNGAAREAVRSTRGVALMDGDRLLRAYYSSTCGGRTAAARETWPTGPGYEYNLAGPIQEHHREFACQQSPLFRWSVERPKGELVQRLRWFGERNGFPVKRIRDLRAIEIGSVNLDGRPSRYRVVESDSTSYALSAEELRLACNTNANGSVASVPAPGVPGSSMPGTSLAGAGSSGVMGYAGGAPAPPGGPMIAAPAPGIPDIDRRTRVHSSDLEVVVRGDKVAISGRGFGHGVGMCQYCAKGFAERGEDWRTMIERFYPGARIVSVY
jgi:stage II sporulation protein D